MQTMQNKETEEKKSWLTELHKQSFDARLKIIYEGKTAQFY